MTGLARRWALLALGSVIASACYALTIRAHLGLGPLFVVQDGLSRELDISVGSAVIIIGVLMLAGTCLVRSWPGPGTVAIILFGGVLIDAILPHVPDIHGIWFRTLTVAAATLVMTFGGALIIIAGLGVHPLDGVMLGLVRILDRPVGAVRLALEASMLIIGALLGGAVGIGTVITCLLTGPGLQVWLRVLGADRGVVPMVIPDDPSQGSISR